MSVFGYTYEKPAVTKNGNIRDITFKHVSWNCSLIGDSSSDYSSNGCGGDSGSDSSS